MKKIAIVLLSLSVLNVAKIFAQNDADVLRLSQLNPSTTARSAALAGATGALGGDFSCTSNNPAGLAMYRNSEFTFSPSIYAGSSSTNYLGTANSDSRIGFGFGNIGFVAKNNYTVKGKPATKGWTGVAFAFGINKLANFSNNVTYTGFNKASSIGDYYAQSLSGKGVTPQNALSSDPMGAGLAYDAYLLDANYPDTTNYTAINRGGNVNQTYSSITHGAVNEMTFSLAGSWDNRLFLGGTVGIPIVNYYNQMTYGETLNANDTMSQHYGFNSFNSTQSITTTGAGINLKLGALFLVNDYLRLGLALHTPTYYSLSDKSTLTMTTVRTDSSYGGTYSSVTDNSINYNIITPWRFIGSGAIMFKKFGFISIDYELMDYTSSHLQFNSTNASDISYATAINQTISNNYNSFSSNIRIGGELKYDIFALRVGYAYYSSPFNTNAPYNAAPFNSNNQTRQVFSIGAGIREHDYFFDMAVQRTMYKSTDSPYVFDGGSVASPLATITTNKTMVMATIGFKF